MHYYSKDKDDATLEAQWKHMASQYRLNPCNSPLHPAVQTGAVPTPEGDEVPVQVAYTPESTCFGCGGFKLYQ